MTRFHVVIALAAVLFSACGGGGEDEQHYRAAAVEECFRSEGLSTDRDGSVSFASPPAEGELHVDFGQNRLSLGFERTSEDAKRFKDSILAEKLASVEQHGNAIVTWWKTPTESETETLDGCLHEGSP